MAIRPGGIQRAKEALMKREDLRVREEKARSVYAGDRIADMRYGEISAALARMAEHSLNAASLERINKDSRFAVRVVRYMRLGYDLECEAVQQQEEREKAWEKRKRLTVPRSSGSYDALEQFCVQAHVDFSLFLRVAGLGFVRCLLDEGREWEQLVELKAKLPVHISGNTNPAGITAQGLARVIAGSVMHLMRPRAAYMFPFLPHYLPYGEEQQMKERAKLAGSTNPALFLEELGVALAEYYIGSDRKKAGEMYSLLERGKLRNSAYESPEEMLGVQLVMNCRTALRWYMLQGKFPDPTLYSHSLRYCCEPMHVLFNRSKDSVNMSGSLEEGIAIDWGVGGDARAYFRACPRCKVSLFVPKGAPTFEKLNQKMKYRLESFLWQN